MTGDERLHRWLEALLAVPGLTAVNDPAEARRVHVDDALTACELVREGPVVDVGSGGGSPGIPLASARPELRFVLLEASRRKCAFLEGVARDFPNIEVVRARAEEYGRGAGRDAFATAVARALAPPPVAVEWCLPLVSPGGRLVLYAAAPDDRCAAVARELGAVAESTVAVAGDRRRQLLVFRKLEPTPDRFPRRPGAARRRPLA